MCQNSKNNYQIVHRRGGLNPPEPAVTTLGVIHKVNCHRADSICPYSKMIAIFCFDTSPSHLFSPKRFMHRFLVIRMRDQNHFFVEKTNTPAVGIVDSPINALAPAGRAKV